MKLFLLFILTFCTSYSQSIQLFNIDASNYPYVRSNILILDGNGNVNYNPDKDLLNILENGNKREILSLECGNIPEKKATSTILSIDLSLSMRGISFNLALQGVTSLIEIMNNKSEVAISGFSDDAILVNDFTSDKDILLNSLNSMILLGGTNFENAFLNKDNGAISLAKRAKNQPIIIFLTDGESSGKYHEVIAEANKINAIVYTIVLFNKVPQFLEEVSNNTGGIIYDNVITLKQIINIYQTIYKLSELDNACSLEWYSNDCDLERIVNYNYSTASSSSKYIVNKDLLSSFNYSNGQFYSFNDTKFSETGRRVLNLEAKVDTLVIDSITSSNPKFKIILPSGINYPITIPKNESISLFIDFNYDVKGFQFSEFNIISNACRNNVFMASGGRPEGSNESYINIIEPNGGEIYYRGADSLIKWQANYPEDKLLIEFSSDNGSNWQEIAKDFSGYNINYKYPMITSDKCLVRVTKLSDSSAYEYKVINTDSLNNTSISWQKSGLNIILGGNDGYIRFVGGFNHTQIKKNYAHPIVTDVEWAPDAFRYASSGSDGMIKFWVENTDIPKDSIQAFSGEVSVIEWSPDGSRLLSGDNFGNLKVWNPVDLSLVKEVKVSQKRINDIRFSPDGRKIALALSDTSIFILFANSYFPISKYPLHKGAITSLDWLDNDRIVSVSSQAFSNEVLVSSSNLASQVFSIKINETLSKVRVNLENKLFTFTGDKGKTYIYNNDDYTEQFDINSESSWRNNDLAWSPDNSRIAVSSFGKNSGQTVKFNAVAQYPEFRTTSQSNFSLINANVEINNFDFGKVLVERTKVDSITNLIKITSLIPVKVDSIRLLNDNDNVFTIQTVKDIMLKDGVYYNLLVSFTPKLEKTYNAKIEIFTELNKYTTSISGTGYSNGIKDYTLDFGELEVNTQLRKQLEISNSSIDDINIDSIKIVGPDIVSFKLIQGGSASILKSKEQNTKLLVFEFEPQQALILNTYALIYFNEENAPSRIKITGIGIKPELAYEYNDSLISNCNQNKTFEIKFKNEGKSLLKITDLSSLDMTFDKINFDILPSKEEIITASININNSGTYNLEYRFNTNDKDSLVVIEGLYFENNLTEYSTSSNDLEFEVNQLNQVLTKEIVVQNTGNSLIKWDYQLPYTINNSNFKLVNIINTEIRKNESSTFTFEYTNNSNLNELENFELIDNCNIHQNITLSSKIINNYNNIEFQSNYSIETKCDSIVNIDLSIKNLEDSELEITEIKSSLEILDNLNYPIKLKSNIQETISLSLKLTEYGIYSEKIIFKINDIEYEITLNIDREEVKFNIIEISKLVEIKSGQKIESYFVIENLGQSDLNWNYINYSYDNVKITDILPLITPVNESSTFYIEYNDLTAKIVNFKIEDECKNSDSIDIEFYLGDIPQLDLSITNINANVGDNSDIEINLNSYDKFDFNDKKGISFKLSYNPSLLKTQNNNYISTNDITIEKHILYFDDLIYNKWIIPQNTILWGNDSTTNLTLSEVKFIEHDETKIVNITNGVLIVLDLCQIGGTRLYKLDNYPYIEQINPHPIVDFLVLNCFLPNNSSIDYEVIDINGNLIYSDKRDYKKGKFDIIVNYDFKSGIYFIKLKILDEKLEYYITYTIEFVVIK